MRIRKNSKMPAIWPGLIAVFFTILANGASALTREEQRVLAAAGENLSSIRSATISLLEDSYRNNPGMFKLRLEHQVLGRARSFLHDKLAPVDMSRVVGAPYSSFNRDIWRYARVAENLFTVAIAYAAPQSPEAGNTDLSRKAAEGFEWILSHANGKGDCQAPDKNINRFHYVPAWEAFVLLAPALPDELRQRVLLHLFHAARHQLETYQSWNGGYPNMDSAHLLILQQAGRLFGYKPFLSGLEQGLHRLESCFSGSTWDYVKGWSPQAIYTAVTLRHVGRLYQLDRNPSALRQLTAHADYFKYFVEPNGVMDFGMAPFIKHAWGTTSRNTSFIAGIEVVQRYAPTSLLWQFIDRIHADLEANPGLFSGMSDPYPLYWLAPRATTGEPSEAPLGSFLRAAPEFAGFQARATDSSGVTLTFYANGNAQAADTRVSAVLSPPEASPGSPRNTNPDNNDILLAGALLEVIQDGVSYFLGDLAPDIKKSITHDSAILEASQRRHAMGPTAWPMIVGNEWKDNAIKHWNASPWKGGSQRTPPVETYEKWVWRDGVLHGEIAFTALEEANIDEVRFSLVPVLPRIVEEKLSPPGGHAMRTGALCIVVFPSAGNWRTSDSGHWSPPPPVVHGGTPARLGVFIGSGPDTSPKLWPKGFRITLSVAIGLGSSLSEWLHTNALITSPLLP